MSYRVETAVSGRAICVATECKKAKVRIDKGELRFGVWVTIQDHAGWKWKHWGCVTGAQIKGLREVLEDPESPGVYRWDYLDGYEGDEKNSLSHFPDLQKKVREVVEQGYIHPEDFNGRITSKGPSGGQVIMDCHSDSDKDPEMNKLGERGLFSRETMKKLKEEAKDRSHEIAEMTARVAQLEAEKELLRQGGTVRSGLSPEIQNLKEEIEGRAEITHTPSVKKIRPEDDVEEETKPAKRKRATKTKAKKEVTDDEEEDRKPVKKRRATKSKVKQEGSEDEEEEVIPVKKQRATKGKVKQEADGDKEVDTKPAKNKRATKSNVKNEADEDGQTSKSKPARKARTKKEIKNEEDADGQMPTVEDEIQPPSPSVKNPRGKRGVKKEEQTEGLEVEDSVGVPVTATAPKKRASRAKQAVQEEEDVESEVDNIKKAPSKKVTAKKGQKKISKNDSSDSDFDMADIPEATADMKNESIESSSSVQEPAADVLEVESPPQTAAPAKTGRHSKSDQTIASSRRGSRGRKASGT